MSLLVRCPIAPRTRAAPRAPGSPFRRHLRPEATDAQGGQLLAAVPNSVEPFIHHSKAEAEVQGGELFATLHALPRQLSVRCRFSAAADPRRAER